jgi:hypothetical protein
MARSPITASDKLDTSATSWKQSKLQENLRPQMKKQFWAQWLARLDWISNYGALRGSL